MGWYIQWFYCRNHEPNLPSFISNLPKFVGSWTEELIDAEMPTVLALAEKVIKLKWLGLTGVSMGANWLARRVIPLKQQVHPSLEYNGIQDPTCNVSHHITSAKLERLLKEMFQSTDSWPTPNHAHSCRIQRVWDPISHLG
jgi:hypothetical protein